MTFVPTGARPVLEGSPASAPEPERPNFFTDVVPAAFRTENLVGSLLASPKLFLESGDADFNPLENIEGYEDHARAFIAAGDEDEVSRVKAAIDRERSDREILAAGGLGGFVATFAAGVVDPTVFLPVGGALKKGESILRATARTAAFGGGATVIQEAGLQATQELRTPEESAINIAGATFLSGVVGAGFSLLTKGEKADFGAKVERDFVHPGDDFDPANPNLSIPVTRADFLNSTSKGSLSAASRDVLDDLDDAQANAVFLSDTATNFARKVRPGDEQADTLARLIEHANNKFAGLADPVYRLLSSPLGVARNLVQDLADVPILLNKNVAKVEKVRLPDGSEQQRVIFGRPTQQSVESAIIRKSERLLGSGLEGVDNIYLRYLNDREPKFYDGAVAGFRSATRQIPKGKLSRPEFRREVWKALARGDTHENPAVAEAAGHLRKEVFKPLEDEAVELGLFGLERVPSQFAGEPDVYVGRRPDLNGTAISYRPRFYNLKKIAERRNEFIGRLHRFYISERDAAAKEAAQIERDIKALTTGEIDVVRDLARGAIKAQTRALRDAKRDLQAAREKKAKADAKLKETGVQNAAAQARTEKLNEIPELSDEQLVYYRGLARDVSRGHGDDRPTTILDFIRAQGGFNKAVRRFENPSIFGGGTSRNETVLDYFGADHVRALQRRQLTREGGKSPDYMREAAEEAGWLPEGSTANDLMDLVDRALRGERVINGDDAPLVDYEEFLTELRRSADEADVDYTDPVALASWMEGSEFTRLTKFQKGKLKEALIREKYTIERFKGAEARAETLEEALAEAVAMERSVREFGPEVTARVKDYKRVLRGKLRDRNRMARNLKKIGRRAEVTDDDLLENARRTTQRIESTPVGALSYDYAEAASGLSKAGKAKADALSGRFKSRRLLIPDSEIEDFLDDDLEAGLRATVRGMVPDIEFMRRFGSVDLEPQIKAIADEFERAAAQIPDGTADKTSLLKARDKAIEDVAGIRDRLRGIYGLPENPNSIGYRIISAVKTINHLRLMGGVTLASIPDLPRVVFTHGLTNFSGVAFEGLVRGLKGLAAASEELRHAGVAFEIVNDTRTMAFADLLDDYGRGNIVERGLSAARANFGQISLMAPWNHAMKSLAGLTTQNRILAAAGDLVDGKITAPDATFLARLGIGEEDARGIAKLWRERGADGRAKSANTIDWPDRRLADVFHDALRKEVDRLIVTPGQEKPFTASGPIGSLIFQFGSYNFAASQRVSMAYAQGILGLRDAHALMAFITQVTLGMGVAALKMQQAGRASELQDWGARRWVAEGIDRSGVLGVLTYYNLLAERATGGRVGLSALAGEGVLSRYHTRNALGAFLGPSFGAGQDIFTVSGSIASGEPLTDGDIAALRRLLPYQNLFYIKSLFDAVERGLGSESAGAPS